VTHTVKRTAFGGDSVKPPKKYKDLICGVCGWDTDSEGLCSNECDGPPACTSLGVSPHLVDHRV